jgi:hypothetical protein
MNRALRCVLIALAAVPVKGVAAEKNAPPTITLYDRHGHVTPHRQGFQHTGAGNIDVSQPTPDTVIITMTGVAVAGGHPCQDSMAAQDFDLEQCLEIGLDQSKAKTVKLTMETRIIGLLRSSCKGGGIAEESAACATIIGSDAVILTVCAPPHSVSQGDNLSINDHAGPVTATLVPGRYTLHQTMRVAVSHPRSLWPCKAASAEFAPDPALDPLWISYFEPFHG